MMFFLAKKIKKQWLLSVFVLFFLPVLLRLGFWQLERAEQKQQLLTVYQQQQDLPVQKLNSTTTLPSLSYQRFSIQGTYDASRFWLLDNKSRAGKSGYEVVMPLWFDQRWVLINRGWVQAPSKRDKLPEIVTPEQAVTISGYFYQESANAVLNTTQSDLAQVWPKRVLQIDMHEAHQALGESTYPVMFRISDDSPSALVTHWPLVNTLPAKHTAYAVQWFLMALVLLLLYGWALIKSEKQ